MGYEIIFHYKEALDSPGSYGEEVKERSCKVGKITDDVPLEVLAGKVMSQLARRNILIVDVEIYEYVKKKMTYREANDGIVLKNRKFSFDSGCVSTMEEFEGDEPPATPNMNSVPPPRACVNLAPRPNRPAGGNSVKHEIFDPEPLALHKARQKGLKFTVGKRYPIHATDSMGGSIVYKTTDDSGKEVTISSEYFVVPGAGLSQDEAPSYVGAENQKEEINLWGNHESADMPEIRRR